MTFFTFLLILNTMASIVIMIKGLFYALNRMNRETKHSIRAAWILVTTGAFAIATAPLFGYRTPCWQEVLFTVGIAVYFIVERRCYYICRQQKPFGGS